MEVLELRTAILKGRGVVGGVVEGEALVTQNRISANMGIDPETGLIIEKGHAIEGKKVKGKVLVFPYGKGSDAWGGVLYATCKLGNGPKAIVNRKADSFVINGVIIAKIPMVIVLDKDPCKSIETGDHVKVDAARGLIEVRKTPKSVYSNE
jgi:predicted aconitase with swiveling domain